MSALTPPSHVRFNSTRHVFENPQTHETYRGVHSLIETICLQNGQSLESIHRLIQQGQGEVYDEETKSRKRLKVAKSNINGLEYGKMIHERVARLIRTKRYAVENTKSRAIKNLIRATNALGWTPFSADDVVADPLRKLSSADDMIFVSKDGGDLLLELKIYKNALVADAVIAALGVMRVPFHVLPLCPRILAEMQCGLTAYMYRLTYQTRNLENCYTVIIARDAFTIDIRRVSDEARQSAAIVLRLWDQRMGKYIYSPIQMREASIEAVLNHTSVREELAKKGGQEKALDLVHATDDLVWIRYIRPALPFKYPVACVKLIRSFFSYR